MIRFVLTGQARTGSTMMGSALGSHPDVVMHGELFGYPTSPLNFYGLDEGLPWPTPIETRLKIIRDQNTVEFLEQFVFAPTGRTAVGYKFKFEEFSALAQRRRLYRANGTQADLHQTAKSLAALFVRL